jgi:DNA-binding protein YbaB
MFDSMKNLSAVAGLLKNQDKLKDAAARVREQMERTRVTGEAGGGAARAVVTGTMRVVEVELAQGLVLGMAADEKTRTLAGSLIAEAVNKALEEAQVKLKAALDAEAKAMGLDGLIPPGGLGGLTGGGMGGLLGR